MFLEDGAQIDELAGTLFKNGSAIVKEIEVRCYDGYELSSEVIGDLAVEAKHDLEVSYTNIETTPIDLSPFAGADETFQFRFTPGAVKGPKAFKIRNGPVAALVPGAVYNDSEDPIFNDSEDPVYAEV